MCRHHYTTLSASDYTLLPSLLGQGGESSGPGPRLRRFGAIQQNLDDAGALVRQVPSPSSSPVPLIPRCLLLLLSFKKETSPKANATFDAGRPSAVCCYPLVFVLTIFRKKKKTLSAGRGKSFDQRSSGPCVCSFRFARQLLEEGNPCVTQVEDEKSVVTFLKVSGAAVSSITSRTV